MRLRGKLQVVPEVCGIAPNRGAFIDDCGTIELISEDTRIFRHLDDCYTALIGLDQILTRSTS
ncbi:MAG: hypothetical protein C4B59_00685 [Candidatus Methanogaster sp.]|uniref:Uncharacterized protein n=1 Tax=Candidatus Methanogaster sp. TaxID=3386292 RepID=A0AC61L745_9EURY|nr:MAG: hypothetical protein C4B59_00685 [ANME-2 cluster archaeon]